MEEVQEWLNKCFIEYHNMMIERLPEYRGLEKYDVALHRTKGLKVKVWVWVAREEEHKAQLCSLEVYVGAFRGTKDLRSLVGLSLDMYVAAATISMLRNNLAWSKPVEQGDC